MIEIVVEQLSAIVYALLAGALGVGGFLVESAGFETLTQGQNVLGAWEAVIGLLLLIAAAKLIREKVLARRAEA
ncbi:hypothetical protein [Halorhabdus rudnickae]|uniref:hypothetical protein n=1 Tax=Halorhabdus rudnickae TaxID=1775544 RepID=UPI0010827969|nr:hypothetical protein [Halorhabdus rudnickae]